MPSDERERRHAPRLPVELDVSVRDLGRPEESREAVLRNIGVGGVFIETSVGLPLGTAVQLDVEVDGEKVSVEGQVIRVEWQSGRSGASAERRVRGLAVEFRPGQSTVKTLLARVERAAPAPGEADA